MFKIKTYNAISQVGLKRFSNNYRIAEKIEDPDAILLRSFNLTIDLVDDGIMAVGRAGAGVNNIPIEALSRRGVVVFNAPGANADSVKELVIAGMFLAARNLPEALLYTSALNDHLIKESIEKGKKKFAGKELRGKTLGIIGLGAIGYRVANSAIDLGMQVLGYDPVMTVQNAWQLSPAVKKVDALTELLDRSDFITIHVPLLDSTRGLLDQSMVNLMKPEATLLNFSRDELVDEMAVIDALNTDQLGCYVTDFPNETTNGKTNVIALPHLGASTMEAEDNSAVMIADQLQDYLENGNIEFSVNFPNAFLARKSGSRLTLAHKNEPGVVAQITSILGKSQVNIVELLNNSRGKLAYTIVDLEIKKLPEKIILELQAIPELLKLRVLSGS